MSSQIARVLSLNQEQQELAEQSAGRLKSLGEWLSQTVEAVKDTPILKILGTAGEAAKEWSGTIKVAALILEKATREHSPQTLGWLACTLAYREAAEEAIRLQGPPQSHLLFSGEFVRDRLSKLRLDEPEIMSGFSLSSSTGHPFVRAADNALLLMLETAGYDLAERRVLIRKVRSLFTGKLQDILSGDQSEKFAPFLRFLQTDTEDLRLYSALAAFADLQRAELEDQPALGVEPFAIDQVYIESECGVLPWMAIRDHDPNQYSVDPFDEASAPREDLMQAVLRLIADPSYDDAIVIQGAPGAGKSTFTRKLCVRLTDSGFTPLRIPLQHLRVDREIFDAIQDVVTRFGGKSVRPFRTDLFREKVFSESVPTEARDISPYVFIFDGWDEISVSADEGFQKRVERLLDSIRHTFLDQTRNTVRVVITGRPSQAIGQANFLRDSTNVLTIRKIRPAHLQRYVEDLARALRKPAFTGPRIESWQLGPTERYNSVLARYQNEFPNVQTLDVLGQPLLVHLALKVMASFKGDLADLISPTTTLYRHLTDLTCKRGGKAPSEPATAGQSARIEGTRLRSLLHGTALAITAFGSEAIPFEELEDRLETLGVGHEVFLSRKDHEVRNLMISFYFKASTEHSGCEFLHKSFREYLAAEAVVEILKDYGRKAVANLPERPEYWKDFQSDDVRFDFSRQLGEVFCAQWLNEEISVHIRELLSWEIDRAYKTDNPKRGAGIVTERLLRGGWEHVRDGLADIWDWWGAGVHLRPQPKQQKRDWKFDDPPFVVDLVRLAMRRANYGRPTPPRPPRTTTVDANLGFAFFQLNCFVHAFISEAKGWTQLARELGPAALWSDAQVRRRYQVQLKHRGVQFVQFAPSGGNDDYFHFYTGRINSAGVAPPSGLSPHQFPEGRFMRGISLKKCFLFCANLAGTDLFSATLEGALCSQVWASAVDLGFANLIGAVCVAAHFPNARFEGADFTGADLERATVDKISLNDLVHLSAKQRAELRVTNRAHQLPQSDDV